MPTEWREGKEKFERGYVGDDQLLRGTQERDIFFKGTPVKASRLDSALDRPNPLESSNRWDCVARQSKEAEDRSL